MARTNSVARRAGAFALHEQGVLMAEIQKLSGFAQSTITQIRNVAYQREYNPDTNLSWTINSLRMLPGQVNQQL